MDDDIAVGMYVRYPRTGTSGMVTHIENERGRSFAEIDSTGLLYRIDQLIPSEKMEYVERQATREENLHRLEEEKQALEREGFESAVNSQDGACQGGG